MPVMGGRTRGEIKRRRVEAMPEGLRGRAAAGGGEGLPRVSVVPASEGEEGEKKAALLGHAVQSLKPRHGPDGRNEGRRECVAVLQVRACLPPLTQPTAAG
jgi:hypothetical protein